MNFDSATAELRKLGITLRRLPGEFQVKVTGGSEENARTAETLEDALALGRDMAETLATTASAAAPGKRYRRPLRMTPKAVRRRMIRKHNRRMRARALRQQKSDSDKAD